MINQLLIDKSAVFLQTSPNFAESLDPPPVGEEKALHEPVVVDVRPEHVDGAAVRVVDAADGALVQGDAPEEDRPALRGVPALAAAPAGTDQVQEVTMVLGREKV